MLRRTTLAALTAMGLLMASCPSGPKEIYVRGAEALNHNPDGQSTPVTVRIFFLRDAGRFTSEPYEKIWLDPKGTLKDDLLRDPQIIKVYPSKDAAAIKVPIGELPDEVRFIGIMGLFSGSDQGDRHIAVPRDEADDFEFVFSGYRIERKPR